MTSRPLANIQFTVTGDENGNLTISGPAAATVTVHPGYEEWTFEITLGPGDGPSMFANSRQEAYAFLADRDGQITQHEWQTLVRWLLPSEPTVGFVDLAEVMRYAAMIG